MNEQVGAYVEDNYCFVFIMNQINSENHARVAEDGAKGRDNMGGGGGWPVQNRTKTTDHNVRNITWMVCLYKGLLQLLTS
jgi:hypothetical protein